MLTEIFESWSFIANITIKKVLFWNEYSNAIHQNPQSEIFTLWVAIIFFMWMCWQRSLRVEALLQILHSKRFYSRMNIQMPFIKILNVKSSRYDWPFCECVDKELWELKLYCKYYTQKGFILEWIFKCLLSKSTKWNFQGINGLYVDVFAVLCVEKGLWELQLFSQTQQWQNVIFLNDFSKVAW